MDGKGVKWDPEPDFVYGCIGELVYDSIGLAFHIQPTNWSGISVTVAVDRTTTVMALKCEIARLEKLKVADIRVLCGGKELNDEQNNLSEHGIRDTTNITVIRLCAAKHLYAVPLSAVDEDMTKGSSDTNDKALQILAKTLSGKSVPLRVDPTTTVIELKSMIARIENLVVADIRILCGGKDLNDDQNNLAEHGVRDLAKITMLTRLRGGAWVDDEEVSLGNGGHPVDLTGYLHPLSGPSFSTNHETGARYSPPRHPGMPSVLSPAQMEFTLAMVDHHRILTRWLRLRGELSFNLAEYTWSMVHMPEDHPGRWPIHALDMLDAFGHAAFQIPWENASPSERVIMMGEYAVAGPSPSPILSARIEDSIAALPAIPGYYEFVDDLLFLGCDTNDVELIHNIVDSVDSNTTYSETQMTSPAEKSSSESTV